LEIALVFYIIMAGVLTYVIGQIIVKIIIDPVQKFKMALGEVAFSLHRYSQVYRIRSAGEATNDDGKRSVDSRQLDKVSEEYRSLASLINSCIYLIPLYYLTRIFFFLPPESDTRFARDELINLSEEIYATASGATITERRNMILKYLRLL